MQRQTRDGEPPGSASSSTESALRRGAREICSGESSLFPDLRADFVYSARCSLSGGGSPGVKRKPPRNLIGHGHGHGWATALIPCVRGARKHPDAWAGFSETQACRGSDTAPVRIRNVWTKCTLVSARAKTILQGSVGKIVYYAPSLSIIFNM